MIETAIIENVLCLNYELTRCIHLKCFHQFSRYEVLSNYSECKLTLTHTCIRMHTFNSDKQSEVAINYVKINRENAESTLIYAILGAERVIHTFPVLGHKNSDER